MKLEFASRLAELHVEVRRLRAQLEVLERQVKLQPARGARRGLDSTEFLRAYT